MWLFFNNQHQFHNKSNFRDEVVRQSGMNTTRNSIDMENHVFMKAKTKEEYLGFVARLILHVREMSKFLIIVILRI